jgi:hypothetical protein
VILVVLLKLLKSQNLHVYQNIAEYIQNGLPFEDGESSLSLIEASREAGKVFERSQIPTSFLILACEAERFE